MRHMTRAACAALCCCLLALLCSGSCSDVGMGVTVMGGGLEVPAAASLPVRAAATRRRLLARRPALPKPTWDLLWSDEFDGTTLNSSKWEAMQGDGSAFNNPGWGNNELQNYTARRANVRVERGWLVITARAEPPGSRFGAYTSARLRTADRFFVAPSAEHPVIRVEARVRLTAGDGLWSAFWMLPQHWVYGNWPASGEIDIMETRNGMTENLGSAHSGGVGALHTRNGAINATLSRGWHVHAIEWEAKQLRWYLNGRQFLAVSSSNGTRQGGWYSLGAAADRPDAPFDVPFHLLINMAVGGNFAWVSPEAVAATLATGPKHMLVDWVRVHGRRA